jgi:hypothetical protein
MKEPKKVSDTMLVLPEEQTNVKDLDIGGVLDDFTIGLLLARMEDFPSTMPLAEIVSPVCHPKAAQVIVNTKSWQEAWDIACRTETEQRYKDWVLFIGSLSLSLKESYLQAMNAICVFVYQTESQLRLHHSSVMVPRQTHRQEVQRRYLAAQAHSG